MLELYNKFIEITQSNFKLCNNVFMDIMKNKQIQKVLNELEAYSKFTYEHSLRVFYLSVIIGADCWYDYDSLVLLGEAALLHDVGKLKIPDTILNKKGRLNEEEWVLMKQHALYSHELISQFVEEQSVLEGVIQHHERCDGSGYPFGLTEEEISNFSKIIATVDIFDAVTSGRPYNNAMSKSEAIELIKSTKGMDSVTVSTLVRTSKKVSS